MLEGDARSLGIADGRRVAAVRDGNDDIRIILRFVPHFPAHVQASLIDILAVDDTVRTGEVNVFEGTDLLARCLGKNRRFDAFFVDLDKFARLYVADKLGTDGVEGTRFRSQDPAAFIGTADAERAETVGVADAVERIFRHEYQRVRPLDAVHAFHDAFFDGVFLAAADEVDDDFTVHRRLERRAAAVQFFPQDPRIGQVAVVRQGQLSHGRVYGQGLDVAGIIGACRRIADVADTDRAAFFVRYAVGEDRADEAHAAERMDILAVSQGDAAAFLATML